MSFLFFMIEHFLDMMNIAVFCSSSKAFHVGKHFAFFRHGLAAKMKCFPLFWGTTLVFGEKSRQGSTSVPKFCNKARNLLFYSCNACNVRFQFTILCRWEKQITELSLDSTTAALNYISNVRCSCPISREKTRCVHRMSHELLQARLFVSCSFHGSSVEKFLSQLSSSHCANLAAGHISCKLYTVQSTGKFLSWARKGHELHADYDPSEACECDVTFLRQVKKTACKSRMLFKSTWSHRLDIPEYSFRRSFEVGRTQAVPDHRWTARHFPCFGSIRKLAPSSCSHLKSWGSHSSFIFNLSSSWSWPIMQAGLKSKFQF